MKLRSAYKILGVIPARYASTRLPGKVLADICGKPMIRHVYERALRALCLTELVVATDDRRVFEAVHAFAGDGAAVMTSPDHPNGSSRAAEVLERKNKEGRDLDAVINIQGDEPFIRPEQIEQLKRCFDAPDVRIATLAKAFDPDGDFEQTLFNPNTPKVAFDVHGDALYFSRSIIPYIRGAVHTEWLRRHTFYKHIGLYAYRAETLRAITLLPQSSLEKAESLEQLRWLENGYRIRVAVTPYDTVGIDTPDDLARAVALLT